MKASKTRRHFYLLPTCLAGGKFEKYSHKGPEAGCNDMMKKYVRRMGNTFLVSLLLAVFNLFCLMPAQAQEAPLPLGNEVFSYEPAEHPKVGVIAADMKPVGVGSVALAGENVALQVALPQFDGPVDVYCALQAPSVNPETFLINSDLSLSALSSGLVKWKDNVTTPIEESLYGIIPVKDIPPGTYYVYLMVTPHEDLGKYTLYSTSFLIPPGRMAPPKGQEIFDPPSTALPVVQTIASQANPIGLGPVVAGEDKIKVRIGLPEFSAPVDVYLALDWPAIDPENIYLINELMELSPLSSGLVKWKENLTGPVSEIVMSDISLAELPPGIYKFYLLVTPAGSTETYFLWSAELSSSTLVVDVFGNGLVTSNANEINCSEDSDKCSASYDPGTTVVLTATPDEDSVFHSWEGCDSVNGNVCTITIDANKTVHPSFVLKETKLNPSVKVLEANAVNLIISQDGTNFYFDPQIMTLLDLQAGDIIISTIGNGFLRRIISISASEEGLIRVETEEASLLDAVEEGDFIASPEDFSVDLKASLLEGGVKVAAIRKTAFKAPEVDLTINKVIYERGAVKVTLVGSMTLDFEPDFKLSIGRKHWVVPYLKQFRAILKMDNADNLAVIAEGGWQGEKRVKLGTMRFSPIPLGYIVLVPQADLYVGVEAGIGASMTAEVTVAASVRAGVIYKRKTGWDAVGGFTKSFSFLSPTVTAQAYARGYINPEFTMLLYGIAGPSVSLDGYLKMDAWVPPLSWTLSAGIQACVGGKIDLVFTERRLPNWCPIRYEEALIQYTPPGVLEVTPAGEFAASGLEGGPFTSKKVYTLTNTGYAPITWSVSASRNWVDARKNIAIAAMAAAKMKSASLGADRMFSIISQSPRSGELSPGDSVNVVVSLTSAANNLSAGTHTASVNFVNSTSNEGNTSRTVSLTVQPADEPPSSPSGLTATALSPSSIVLAWTSSTDETEVSGYRIERCTGSGCTDFTQVGTSTTSGYTDSGLSADTAYTYRVRAYDNTGNNSGYSNTASASTRPETTPPTVPGNLNATALSPSEISLGWGASTDEGGSGLAGYKIERCMGSECTNFTQIGTTTATNYTDTGLNGDTSYSYQVRAYDNAGNNSGYSNAASAMTPVPTDVIPPTVPGNLNATALSPSEISLGWGASTDEGGSGLAGYKIERCTGSGCTDFTQTGTSATTSYTDTGLSENTTYSYRVRAYDNDANNSDGYSNTASATTPGIPPTIPGNLTATALTPNDIELNWSASTDSGGSDLAGYKIERCTGSGCTNFTQTGTSATTGYTDTGLSADTTYTYRVRAYDNAGNNSGYSNPASATTPPEITPPTVPGNLTGNTDFGVVKLSWNASTDSGGSGLAGYKIERCTGSGCTDFSQIGTSTTASYTDSGLSEGTYTYRVRAYDNAGNHSGYSNVLSLFAPDNIPPTAPGNLTATPLSSTEISLSWNASTDNGGSGLGGYWIERCTGAGCTDFTQVWGSQNLNTSYTDTGLSPGTYSYRVAAFDNQSNYSGYSNTVTVRTPDPISPTVPVNLTVTQTNPPYGCDVELSWSASTDSGGSGLAGYRIERCGEPFQYSTCTTFAEIGTSTTASFSECLYPGTYNYRVRAYDNDGNNSGYSNSDSVTVNEQPI
jgi:fibronectin type 3 domain-containing protein